MSLTEKQLKDFASQLSQPSGEQGLDVAAMMYDTNVGMIASTIDALSIIDRDQILELGHGNGSHIDSIIRRAKDIEYYGLEISELMKSQAESLPLRKASFQIYDGEHIPFENDFFTKGFTVNTIYFWKNPTRLLTEIHRVLKPNGVFAIGFVQRDFMQNLPFTKYGFTLYNDSEIRQLIRATPFKLLDLIAHTEMVKTRADELVDRPYAVAVLQKQSSS